jgi:DNA invertase Pin-like site-specific DNA recombinase
MNRQPETKFTTLLAQWPDIAAQPMLNQRSETQTLTILYERLSHDDDFAGESNSITNQKSLLQDYALKNAFPNIIHLTDDGYSGTRFDRPAFLRAMELVEAGCVSVFAVKDLSRFGRDHLRVGLYTERLRECGVRFIAIQDNVDTVNGEDDFTPFRNIINEWAARDSSRKTKAIFRARALEGKHVCASVPYGYLRDPADKGQWILDKDAAPVVQRIYRLVMEGRSVCQIANILTADKILIPGAHWKNLGVMNRQNHIFPDPYQWHGTTIRTMLRREEYLGHTVNFKTYKDSYKDKQRKFAPKDQRMIFENTHQPIIDSETWPMSNVLFRPSESRTSMEP